MADVSELSTANCPPDEAKPLLPGPSTQQSSSSSTTFGYVLMVVCSSVCFAFMATFVHIGQVNYGFSPMAMAYIRSVLHTILSFIIISFSFNVIDEFYKLSLRNRIILIFRGLAGAAAFILQFSALGILPVGVAVCVYFTHPVMVMVFSRIFLGEPIMPTDWVAAVFSFIGIFLVFRPDQSFSAIPVPVHQQILGLILGLSAAVCGSASYVLQRAMGTSVHFMFAIFSLSIASLLFTIPLGGFVGPATFSKEPAGFIVALVAAIFAFGAHSFLNKGLQHCRAGPATLIRNVDIPLVYLLGFLILGEKVSYSGIFGSAMVLFGAILTGMRPIFQRRSSGD